MKKILLYSKEKILSRLIKRPYAIRLDTNNACNLNCIYCGINDNSKPVECMSVEQYDQLANLFFHRAKYVSLSFGTEPLMSKNFSLFIEKLGKYKVPQTHFITNGLLLSKKVIETAIFSGIDAITISNDAVTQETYKRIRGGDFDILMSNLMLIQKLKIEHKSATPLIRIQYTLFDFNKTEVIPFIKQYHPFFQEIYVSHLSPKKKEAYADPILTRLNREEFIILREKVIQTTSSYQIPTKIVFNDYARENLSGKWCNMPISSRFIYFNGNLMMCDKNIYGNIFNEDLKTINKRIDAAFQKHNPSCRVKCTQPIAKHKGLDYRPA